MPNGDLLMLGRQSGLRSNTALYENGWQFSCWLRHSSGLMNMRMDIEDIVAEADKVFTRGTFRGSYHGAPLSAWKIADGVVPIVLIPGMTLFRIERRKIGEVWVEENFLEVLRQLGISVTFPPELPCIKGWAN